MKKLKYLLFLFISLNYNLVKAESLLDFKIEPKKEPVIKIKPLEKPFYNKNEAELLKHIQNNKPLSDYLENVVEIKKDSNLYKLETYAIKENIPENIKHQKIFQKHVKRILSNFNSVNDLDAEIIDNREKFIRDFITSTSQTIKHGALELIYYPDILVNHKSSSFCFISFDPNQNLIKSYIDSKVFTEEEALEYLAFHEMGHCLFFNNSFSLTAKENEILADSFAIGHFINEKNYKMAQKILDYVKLPKKEKIHENYPEVASFALNFNKNKKLNNITYKNFNEIINFIKNSYTQTVANNSTVDLNYH